MNEEQPYPLVKGVTADCGSCGMTGYVPINLCRAAGTVRCSYCRNVLKRDARPWWRRLASAPEETQ